MAFQETLNAKHVDATGLIDFWRKHPVQAALDIFGTGKFDLNMPQRISLESRWSHQKHYDIFSRGCGKTFQNAVFACLYALLYPGQRIGIIGPSFRQAKMVWAEIEKLYEISPLLQEACADSPKITPEKCYLKFKGSAGQVGSVIEALPIGTDGSKIRGARYFCVIADELAQVDKQTLDIVIGGFLATRQNPMEYVHMLRTIEEARARGENVEMPDTTINRFIGSSTAYYQYNHLWSSINQVIEKTHGKRKELIRKGLNADHLVVRGGGLNNNQIPGRYFSDGTQALLCVPYWDVDRGFLAEDWINGQRGSLSQYTFDMEYCAFFPPDSEGFFRRQMLDGARNSSDFSIVFRPRAGCRYVMGIDPARVSDNFAASVFEIDTNSGLIRLVRMYTWANETFPNVHRALREIVKLYKIELIKMDSGGGGTTIRDLFADQTNCPAGDNLILEMENEEHQGLTGKRILAALVQFANYEWLKDANEGLLSAIQHRRMLIASSTIPQNEIYMGEAWDKADAEMEATMVEMSTIVVTISGNRMHWDTPQANQRKDRYTAVLLGFDAARQLAGTTNKPKRLATGGWLN